MRAVPALDVYDVVSENDDGATRPGIWRSGFRLRWPGVAQAQDGWHCGDAGEWRDAFLSAGDAALTSKP